MSSDNVIHLAARRDSEAIGHASGRNAERDRTRWNEADALLQKLRETKRLKKADQATLVDNIGRLILQFDAANAKAIATRLLQQNEAAPREVDRARRLAVVADPSDRVVTVLKCGPERRLVRPRRRAGGRR